MVNGYVIFKEYFIDSFNPESMLAIFFFMMCYNELINFENFNNFYFLVLELFPWYKLDKITKINENFKAGLLKLNSYCCSTNDKKTLRKIAWKK